MTFGFPPKAEATVALNGLSPERYLAIALETITQLGWTILRNGKNGFTAHTSFSWTSWGEDFVVAISGEEATLTSRCTGSQIIDWGKNSKNIDTFTNQFNELLLGGYAEKIKESIPADTNEPVSENVDPEQVMDTTATTENKFKSFFSLFVPRQNYFITPIIIDLNIAVFVLMVLSGVSFMEPTTEDMLKWGANFRATTLSGEWWRLLTNTFLHIGVLHLLLNMYALAFIGVLLEHYLGKLRFVTAYLCTGILASLTSIYIHAFTVSAGASGAIFGMYGVFLAMLTTNVIEKKARISLLTSIGLFVALNLMNGMKEGIDNAAHVGGLLSGIIIGYAYVPALKKPGAENRSYVATFVIVGATIIGTIFMLGKIPNVAAQYDAKIGSFSKKEADALKVFSVKDSSAKILLPLIASGLNDWKESLKILDSAEKLDVTDELQGRVILLEHYTNLRIKSYNLIYKAVNENSVKYRPSIDSCTKAINKTVDSLKGN